MQAVQFVIGSALLLSGTVFFVLEVFGIYKLNYALNRMHIAAMGDTLGLDLSILGLIVYSGMSFTSLKLLLIMLFMMITSPVCSHLLSQLEVITGKTENVYDTMNLEEKAE